MIDLSSSDVIDIYCFLFSFECSATLSKYTLWRLKKVHNKAHAQKDKWYHINSPWCMSGETANGDCEVPNNEHRAPQRAYPGLNASAIQ